MVPGPPSAGSTDAVLGAADLDGYLLDLRIDAPDAVRSWPYAPAKLRLVGPRYAPQADHDSHMTGGALADWFDLIIHTQQVTPARPAAPHELRLHGTPERGGSGPDHHGNDAAVIGWIQQRARPLTLDLDDLTDLEPLRAVVGDAKVVGLGGATRGGSRAVRPGASCDPLPGHRAGRPGARAGGGLDGRGRVR